ncbi:sugar-binding transcriptional regulator [Salinispira pacifica]
MRVTPSVLRDALTVAKLYYYNGLNTEAIAREMSFSRPKVSRLLGLAREQGLVEIRVRDQNSHLAPISQKILDSFGLREVHVVPVPAELGEVVWLQRVAQYAASHLNATLEPGQTVGIAWGTTLSEVSAHLVPKRIEDLTIVQLNGSGNTYVYDNSYAAKILNAFAVNYDARMFLFPVPTFFDFPQTREAMWRERSIRRIVSLQQQADLFLFSIGAVSSGVASYVYSGGYLEQQDLAELEQEQVVGDIATVFFRADGSTDRISLNRRASGPPLELFRKIPKTLCIVSGRAKVNGLLAALRAGYISDLVIDEPTARLLVQRMEESPEG